MSAVRILGGLGKTIIALGVLILLFGVFQLWGTGIIEARNQDTLANDFDTLLTESQAANPSNSNNAASASVVAADPATNPTINNPTINTMQGLGNAQTNDLNDTDPSSIDSSINTGSARADEKWLQMLYRNEGEAIAQIEIPALNLNKTVVKGVRASDLRKGPGHYPSTAFPGQAGNAAIAGHRSTYGAPFEQIDKLKAGDEIVMTTIQGEFTYRVIPQGSAHGHFIVSPAAVEVLDQDFSVHPNRLTLTACHPRGSALQRIIVVAELISTPAPTFVQPSQMQPDQMATQTSLNTPQLSQSPQLANEDLNKADPDRAASGSNDPAVDPVDALNPVNAADTAIRVNPVRASSFGEGLNGDSDAVGSAILWGLAALAVWITALFAGNRWKRLPAYAIAALPLTVMLFIAFWHIDQALPAY
ncbi:MAG: sortase [Acidimicrobiia bacterium]|nr:sortase [Acidimicrobiia bacterium]MYC57891.1 sortase [Acidimicrobiia bacterium]MYI29801.1 sortase [Acidimicrobiia bacterium]